MLLVLSTASAAPVVMQVVDAAVDKSDATSTRLDVRFNMPVNYLWHYPKTRKNIFFIAVQPIVSEGQYDLAIRQKVLVPPSMRNIIENLNYDGSEPNSRFLVLETTKAVKITVNPERNNIMIEFSGLEPQPATQGKDKNKKEGQSSGKK